MARFSGMEIHARRSPELHLHALDPFGRFAERLQRLRLGLERAAHGDPESVLQLARFHLGDTRGFAAAIVFFGFDCR